MSSTRRTVNRIAAALLAISALALSEVAWAEDPARLRLAALVEEADLLLEELAGLQPVIERLRAEGERLAAAQTALRAELAGLEREIAAYNEAAGALAEGARQHRGRCPRESDDSGLIERCNAAGAELMDRYAVLERQRAELAERRQALNQRIDQHNAARIAWQADKRDNGPRIDTNESDANRWVGSARGFMVSDAFAALAREADGPDECARLRVSDGNAYHGTEGLKSLHACLQAVRAGLR
jgi:chromosome segregation ATPase